MKKKMKKKKKMIFLDTRDVSCSSLPRFIEWTGLFALCLVCSPFCLTFSKFFVVILIFPVCYALTQTRSRQRGSREEEMEDEGKWRGSQYRCGRVGRGIQPPSTPQVHHSHTQNASKTLIFALFDSCSRTDGPTDRRTVKGSYRVACPQLKNEGMDDWMSDCLIYWMDE